jgi:hypothetical protein
MWPEDVETHVGKQFNIGIGQDILEEVTNYCWFSENTEYKQSNSAYFEKSAATLPNNGGSEA